MSKIQIEGKVYDIRITLGVLADLEKRGYNIEAVTGGGFNLNLIRDLLELAAGVPVTILRGLMPAVLVDLSGPVNEAIAEAFGADGEADGEPEAETEPGELSR